MPICAIVLVAIATLLIVAIVSVVVVVVVVGSIGSVVHDLVFSCAWFRYRDPLTGKIYTSVDSSYTVRLFKVKVVLTCENENATTTTATIVVVVGWLCDNTTNTGGCI